MIRRTQIEVTDAAGGAGVATANTTSTDVVDGVILAVYLAYDDSPPATTDVTIVEAAQSPALPVLTVSNANTDGWFYPVAQAQGLDGVDLVGQAVPVMVADHLKATIAQANNDDGVTVTVVWDDLR